MKRHVQSTREFISSNPHDKKLIDLQSSSTAVVDVVLSVVVQLHVDHALHKATVVEEQPHELWLPHVHAAVLQLDQGDAASGDGEVLTRLQLPTGEDVGVALLEVVAVAVQGVNLAALKVFVEDLNVNLKGLVQTDHSTLGFTYSLEWIQAGILTFPGQFMDESSSADVLTSISMRIWALAEAAKRPRARKRDRIILSRVFTADWS